MIFKWIMLPQLTTDKSAVDNSLSMPGSISLSLSDVRLLGVTCQMWATWMLPLPQFTGFASSLSPLSLFLPASLSLPLSLSHFVPSTITFLWPIAVSPGKFPQRF